MKIDEVLSTRNFFKKFKSCMTAVLSCRSNFFLKVLNVLKLMWRFHSIPLKWFRLLRNSVFEAYIAAILFRNYEKMEKSVTR